MTLEMRYKELLEQGFEEGLEQGLEQGIEKMQAAIKMLKAGDLSAEEISKHLDLTVEQVLELKKEIVQ